MNNRYKLTWPVENIKIVSVARVIKPDSSVNIYLVRMNKNKIFNSIVVYYASNVSDDYVVRDLACRMKNDLKLSDRIYKCDCGNIIDRDYQAALNLKQYGENILKQQSVA